MTAARILRPRGSGSFVLFCDHAGNRVPPDLHSLGLPSSELARHIAWDIGAAGVTGLLSAIFDAPAILCETSRLVIDCNRHPDASDLIPEATDGTVIPGNLHLSEAERAGRLERWFHPYHEAVESVLLEREARGAPSIAVSIHSMTPVLAGQPRPWQISLSSHLDRTPIPSSLYFAVRATSWWEITNLTIWIRRWTTASPSTPCGAACHTSRWNSARTKSRMPQAKAAGRCVSPGR